MSSFGSFTPVLSEEEGEAMEGVDGERFLLISTEESNTSFFREAN